MANVPEYAPTVVYWEEIKEDIPALLSNPYIWLEEQLNIAPLRTSRIQTDKHFKNLLDIMHMLNGIHFHEHDE